MFSFEINLGAVVFEFIQIFIAWLFFCIGIVNLVGVATKYAASLRNETCSLENKSNFWGRFVAPLLLGLYFSIWYLLLFR